MLIDWNYSPAFDEISLQKQPTEVLGATATTCWKLWSCCTLKMAKMNRLLSEAPLELDPMTLGGALMKVPQLHESCRGNVVVLLKLLQITSLTKAPLCCTPVLHNKGTC